MNLSIRQLTKRFGDTVALREIGLQVESQELFFLLGPSGCGKTTLLRTLAGFYQPDGGEVFFGDRRMNGVAPHERNAGMVFQNYALWPHMSVAENVAYGLEVRGVAAAERARRVQEALATVRMEAFATRSPNQLSGGQQQRVALARALVIRPDVLLLDEPLSNLDAKLRLELREEIRRIHDETRITTVYVTHDQKEALSLADRLAVMRDGRIEQVGDPRSVYRNPDSRFVADFIGETNWIAGTVAPGGEPVVDTEAGPIRVASTGRFVPGDRVSVGFRPEAVEIGEGDGNGFDVTVRHVSYLGEVEQYDLVMTCGVAVKALESNPREIRKPGTRLRVRVQPSNTLVLRD